MDNDKWIWNILHKIISRKWIGHFICKLLLRLDTAFAPHTSIFVLFRLHKYYYKGPGLECQNMTDNSYV